jgi:hypothetical protein
MARTREEKARLVPDISNKLKRRGLAYFLPQAAIRASVRRTFTVLTTVQRAVWSGWCDYLAHGRAWIEIKQN